MDKALTDLITLAIAMVGAVLGVLNCWRNWSQDRVRIRVRVHFLVPFQGGTESIGIEVINFNAFPVTLTHMGFTLLDSKRHMQIAGPKSLTGEGLPVRLEPRASFTGYAAPAAHHGGGFANVRAAYVNTACGLRIAGRERDMRRVRDKARAGGAN